MIFDFESKWIENKYIYKMEIKNMKWLVKTTIGSDNVIKAVYLNIKETVKELRNKF